MFAGTGSDVGKSIVATAFCRIFLQDGYQPAPFKAQNMALNSYATTDGLEIGRAQAVQAEAAGLLCTTDMNPLLLKPTSDHVCQVVLNGRVVGNKSASDYFNGGDREQLRAEVNSAFDRLKARYNPVVLEGAGSIAEVNLRSRDLVNMPMAQHASAAVFLVADIDRGGVIASVYGTIMLLTEQERQLVKGIIINKFRGDISLFEDGVKAIENLCNIPVLGVIPHFKDIYIEAEDSVSLEIKKQNALKGKVNVVVVLLRHMSNFTDFDVMERDSRIHLFYSNNTDEIAKADIIIIPGTKNTIVDLYQLRKDGMANAIIRAHRAGKTVMGICGGYQMMGMEVCDPLHVEGDIERLPGLGLLPVRTSMQGEKVTRQIRFNFLETEDTCEGYEIHMGQTELLDGDMQVLNQLSDGSADGVAVGDRCFGTYIHGILDNPAVIDHLLSPYLDKLEQTSFDYRQFKELQYDLLASHVRAHVDMEKVYEILENRC
jgi:adenosylcobyric acid synthase